MIEHDAIYKKVVNNKQQNALKNIAFLIVLHGKDLTEREIDYTTNFKCQSSSIHQKKKRI